eukprot:scaffold33776_cov222-Skeletonema_dohrnii-CCMP3373.AAC.2
MAKEVMGIGATGEATHRLPTTATSQDIRGNVTRDKDWANSEGDSSACDLLMAKEVMGIEATGDDFILH